MWGSLVEDQGAGGLEGGSGGFVGFVFDLCFFFLWMDGKWDGERVCEM